MALPTCDPSTIVIFGGTGDLSRRKLLPALARLAEAGHIHARCRVLAVGRDAARDDAWFRAQARAALAAVGIDPKSPFVERMGYQPVASRDDYPLLAARLAALEAEDGLPPNRTFYLALPPRAFRPTIEGLGAAGLNRSEGWTRVVVEKPFGNDLISARELNAFVHEHFDERQIYRIDHYLGKDSVQNLLVFRFANAFIESLWNRNHVEAIQITAAESLGVGTRASYYDHAGAMRDMVQNHLTQLLTLVAMEPPVSFSADAIRDEKIKVLRSLMPLRREDYVRGRYVAGEIDGEEVPGYLDEQGIPPDSTTETFVALHTRIQNWRWQGVPIYLRTGKRLARRLTKIAIRFRDSPVRLFNESGRGLDTSDVLIITLQPNEGFSIHLDVKSPGSPFRLERIPLSFRYEDRFEAMPDAYQTLLHDVMTGDQTLFVRADEVEASWTYYASLFDVKEAPAPYPAGSWGPAEAEKFTVGDKEIWRG